MLADHTLNVVAKNLAVAFSTTLSETLKMTKLTHYYQSA